MSGIQTVDYYNGLLHSPLRPTAASYNEDEIAKFRRTCDWMDQINNNLHNTKTVIPSSSDSSISYQNHREGQATSIFSSDSINCNNNLISTPSHPSQSYIYQSPPVSNMMSLGEHDMGSKMYYHKSQHLSQTVDQSHDINSSSPQDDDDDDDSRFHSISNSNCVPVEGKLVDLPDNEYYSADDGNYDEGGIEILAESTEDEYEESIIRDESTNEHPNRLSRGEQTTTQMDGARTSNLVIETLSMYENDSIVIAAAARVNENFVATIHGHDSLDFEQLLHEAGDRSISDAVNNDDIGANLDTNIRDTDQFIVEQSFWRRRNPFSLSSATKSNSRQLRGSMSRAVQQPPVRARSTQHDKYVVEIDILPLDTHNSSLEIRDVMDIMANMELLHLWFDPIPAIFETAIKDGSTVVNTSPRSSPSNSLEDNSNNTTAYNNNRQYDGQWVEISTPPLKIPPGAWLSGCSRWVRVAFRSLIGFPARIRSTIFVERSCGRMGITLGPYPDGFMCNSGTMAYHSFHICISDAEEVATGTSRRCVVISDEVRLQRDQSDEFNGIRRICCLCVILRYMLGLLERTILFRRYKPDLASYMQQTISSMEKLRSLVERGESTAYLGGEIIMNDEEWHDQNELSSPLLG